MPDHISPVVNRRGHSDPMLLVQDVFSMGCVIAELFLEGKALFDLSKVMLEYLQAILMHFCANLSCTNCSCQQWIILSSG